VSGGDGGDPVPGCPFCEVAAETVLMSNRWCYAIRTGDTGVPVGSAMVLPKAHRVTVFDLTEAEWLAHRELLARLREQMVREYRPDGWNVGWNVGPVGGQSVAHAHCHLVPRYADESHAGRGIRYWIKQPDNRAARHKGAAD
jgi:histidine triad (HIT) family protein